MTCPVSISMDHLHHSLSKNNERISVVTQYGPVIGGRTSNGVAVFLGAAFDNFMFGRITIIDQRYHMPFRPSGLRILNPCNLTIDTRIRNISKSHHVRSCRLWCTINTICNRFLKMPRSRIMMGKQHVRRNEVMVDLRLIKSQTCLTNNGLDLDIPRRIRTSQRIYSSN